MLKENEIATKVLDICFCLHRKYGPGLFESVYEELVCFELGKAGFSFTRQQAIPLVHSSIKLELGFRADVIVENSVLFEFKSIEQVANVHYKQVLTYLRLTGLKLGILVNFNVAMMKDGVHRIANKL